MILNPQQVDFTVEKENCLPIVQSYALQKAEVKVFEIYPLAVAASLTIKTSADAVVRFQGEEYPGGFQNKVLMPQQIDIVVEKEFCEPVRKSYYLSKNEQKVFEIYPNDISANLTINTYPNATTSFNGKEFTGPILGMKILPEVLDISFTMPKAKTISKVVTLKPKSHEVLDLFPDVQTGSLQLATIPTNARIKLNGDAGEFYTATGRNKFADIPRGEYQLEVALEGYVTHTEKVVLADGEFISRSIELAKVSYKLWLRSARVNKIKNDLSILIKHNGKVMYQGKWTNEFNFGEQGNYDITVYEPHKFEFKEIVVFSESGEKTVEIFDQVAAKREKIEAKNKELGRKLYEEDNEVLSTQEVPLIVNMKDVGADEPEWSIPITVMSIDGQTGVQFPLFMKMSMYGDNYIEDNIKGFFGLSMAGNIMISPKLTVIDVLSFHAGLELSTSDHKNIIIFDFDALGKWCYGYDLKYMDKKISYAKRVEEDNEVKYEETTFGGWVPFECYASFERFIGGDNYIFFKVGGFMLSDEGSHPDAKWYYSKDLSNWEEGENEPTEIGGTPKHPIYDGFVPYIGAGIRF